jgi:hypothetical protein
MLQKSLEEIDPETTDVIVMTAKTTPPGGAPDDAVELDRYDRKLITAVVQLAEKIGKKIRPIVVPTNNPLFAVINTARSLHVQELVVGASNKYTPEEQLDQVALYWISLHEGHAAPLTVRILSRNWDVHYDIGGGARIPRISERKARSVGELRAAGVGVRSALLVHDGTHHGSDVFSTVLTMLDPDVGLVIARVTGEDEADPNSLTTGTSFLADIERARKVGREVDAYEIAADVGPSVLQLVKRLDLDLIVLSPPAAWGSAEGTPLPAWIDWIKEHATCAVAVLSLPAIPQEVESDPAAVAVVEAQSNDRPPSTT